MAGSASSSRDSDSSRDYTLYIVAMVAVVGLAMIWQSVGTTLQQGSESITGAIVYQGQSCGRTPELCVTQYCNPQTNMCERNPQVGQTQAAPASPSPQTTPPISCKEKITRTKLQRCR